MTNDSEIHASSIFATARVAKREDDKSSHTLCKRITCIIAAVPKVRATLKILVHRDATGLMQPLGGNSRSCVCPSWLWKIEGPCHGRTCL